MQNVNNMEMQYKITKIKQYFPQKIKEMTIQTSPYFIAQEIGKRKTAIHLGNKNETKQLKEKTNEHLKKIIEKYPPLTLCRHTPLSFSIIQIQNENNTKNIEEIKTIREKITQTLTQENLPPLTHIISLTQTYHSAITQYITKEQKKNPKIHTHSLPQHNISITLITEQEKNSSTIKKQQQLGIIITLTHTNTQNQQKNTPLTNAFIEAILQHKLITAINSIKDIQFTNLNYTPSLTIANSYTIKKQEHINHILMQIALYTAHFIKAYYTQLTQQQNTHEKTHINITLITQEDLLKNIHNDIELQIIMKKIPIIYDTLTKNNKEKEKEDIQDLIKKQGLIFHNLHELITPHSLQILSPLHYDPLGYLFFHTDILPLCETLKHSLLAKKETLPTPLSPQEIQKEHINTIIQEYTLQKITKISFTTLRNPPPTPINAEIALIKIPNTPYYAMIDEHMKGTFLKKFTLQKIIQKYAYGTQTEDLWLISKLQILSPLFTKITKEWKNILWMNSHLKETLKNLIPKDLYEKIITEKETKDKKEILQIAKQKKHPAITQEEQKDQEIQSQKQITKTQKQQIIQQIQDTFTKGNTIPTLTISWKDTNGKDYIITLKDVKITAKKMIIKKINKNK